MHVATKEAQGRRGSERWRGKKGSLSLRMRGSKRKRTWPSRKKDRKSEKGERERREKGEEEMMETKEKEKEAEEGSITTHFLLSRPRVNRNK